MGRGGHGEDIVSFFLSLGRNITGLGLFCSLEKPILKSLLSSQISDSPRLHPSTENSVSVYNGPSHVCLIGTAASPSVILRDFILFFNKDMYSLRHLKVKLRRQK